MAEICTDDESKEKIGLDAEDEFDHNWLCVCGTKMIPQSPPLPDRICPICGVQVDIKGAPEAAKYGAICISQIPFEKYPENLYIAWRVGEREWRGIMKREAIILEPPRSPDTLNRKRPTSYYRISIYNFWPLQNIFKLQENQ